MIMIMMTMILHKQLCMLIILLVFSVSFNSQPTNPTLALASAAEPGSRREATISNGNALTRKLLPPTHTSVNRAGEVESCSKDAIELVQGPLATLPSGIPTYIVVIVNACVSGCTVSDIHLSCGWFSSATLVDPNIFKRVAYDDCLVNAGEPLTAGQSVSFHYANTFSYPMTVSSVVCE